MKWFHKWNISILLFSIVFTTQSNATAIMDAWDTFRDDNNKPPSNRNISTKIVNKPFKVSLGAINATGTKYENKIDSVDVAIYDSHIKQISNENITFDCKTNPHLNQTDDFTVDKAVKEAFVGFKLCGIYNANSDTFTMHTNNECSGSIHTCKASSNFPEWHVCFSSDGFAIRPKEYNISVVPNSAIKAGEDFNITINALDYNEDKVNNYNENITINQSNSVHLQYSALDTTNCITDTLIKVSDANFTNGVANLTLNYKEVGDLVLTVSEVEGSEYAYIDSNDTSDTNRKIDTSTTTIRLIPDHFSIIGKYRDFHISPENNFTYISDDLSMSSKLELNITALAKDNNITTNYHKECAAKTFDLNISFDYSEMPNNLSKLIGLVKEDNNLVAGTIDIYQDLDKNISLDSMVKDYFVSSIHKGSALVNVKIGFNRKYYSPQNPFDLNIKDVNITDEDGVKGDVSIEQNATYLYARVQSTKYLYDDIETNSTKTPIKVEVYCDKWPPSTKCLGIDVLNSVTNDSKWYISLDHNQTNGDGNISFKTNDDGNVTSEVNITNSGINSDVTVTTNSDDRPAIMDIEIKDSGAGVVTSNWLIYNKDLSASDLPKPPNPFCKVRFIGNSTWSGEGKIGNVVDTNASMKKPKRLDW